jgi:hypothetical protein
MESDLKAAAVYGTKHSIEDTRKFLREKYKERGYDFGREDFYIQKDEDNTVTIMVTYQDEITYFGFTLKELEFRLKATKRETEEFF